MNSARCTSRRHPSRKRTATTMAAANVTITTYATSWQLGFDVLAGQYQGLLEAFDPDNGIAPATVRDQVLNSDHTQGFCVHGAGRRGNPEGGIAPPSHQASSYTGSSHSF
jgi:hypothetical protein